MIRVIGSILMVLGTAVWGFGGAASLKRRARGLSAMTASLSVMRGEICDRLTPMPELMEQLSKTCPRPACRFYSRVCARMFEIGDRPFGEIWRDCVSRDDTLMLRPRERQVLSELGLSLGRYNTDEQRGAIDYAIRRMEELTSEAERESRTNSRLYAYMGVASGVFAVVVLL